MPRAMPSNIPVAFLGPVAVGFAVTVFTAILLQAGRVTPQGYVPAAITPQVHPAVKVQARSLQDARSSSAQGRDSAALQIANVKGLAGVLLASHRLPTAPNLDTWTRSLAMAGVSALILDLGTEQPASRSGATPGVYFRTDWAVTIRDVVGEVVPVAHRHGLAVFAAINLRRMSWLEPDLGWNDQAYDPSRRRLRLSESLDLFHPAFQGYLIGLFTDLLAGGVDGILFKADASLGPMEGFSSFGLAGYERDFGVRPDPGTFYVSAEKDARFDNSLTGGPDYSPEFWRWMGWKSRETLKIMGRLKQAARGRSQHVRVALEVHAETVTDPVGALVQYGEDLLEAKRTSFDYYLVNMEPLLRGTRQAAMSDIVRRAIELIGEPERTWIRVPIPSGDILRLHERVQAVRDRASPAGGIGLIYAEQAGFVP